MRRCTNCTDRAEFIFLPGNVAEGVPYCTTHMPLYALKLIGTPAIVSAYAVPQEEVAEPAPTKSKKKTEAPAPEPEEVTVEEVPAEPTDA